MLAAFAHNSATVYKDVLSSHFTLETKLMFTHVNSFKAKGGRSSSNLLSATSNKVRCKELLQRAGSKPCCC